MCGVPQTELYFLLTHVPMHLAAVSDMYRVKRSLFRFSQLLTLPSFAECGTDRIEMQDASPPCLNVGL